MFENIKKCLQVLIELQDLQPLQMPECKDWKQRMLSNTEIYRKSIKKDIRTNCSPKS